MFGILRPCRHRLPGDLATSWLAHLCGLCLALRDDHGQFARTVTNYDGLVISALVEAQAERDDRRVAGPCPLRAMRSTPVAEGSGARLAAAVSLVLASAKVRDHVEDRDGVLGRRPVSDAARSVARRWSRQGARTGADLGFGTAVLLDAVGRQAEVEASVGPGSSVLAATEPTETATAAAFAHTAVVAGRPGNAEPLAEAGRLFGRIAHLLDAVEDLAADRAAGQWNPITATGAELTEIRRLCDDAVMGVRLALGECAFRDQNLIHALLVHELGTAVHRTFRAHYPPDHDPLEADRPVGKEQHTTYRPEGQHPHDPYRPESKHPHDPYRPEGQGRQGEPGNAGYPPPGAPGPGGPVPPPFFHGPDPNAPKPSRCLCWRWPRLTNQPSPRGILPGCLACLYECGSCQQCCRDPYPGPWSGKKRSTWCDICDCGDCCQCCDC